MLVTEIIRTLTKDELVGIAKEWGISVSPNFSKFKIFDLLEKALGTTKPEEKVVLPPGLVKETRIRLLPKNPLWGYAYWEIDAEELKKVVVALGVSPQVIRKKIRIFNIREDLGPGFESPLFFDEEVPSPATSRYIRFGVKGARYYLELGIYLPKSSQFIPLCRSNTIEPGTPLTVSPCEKWVVPSQDDLGHKEVKADFVKKKKKSPRPVTDAQGSNGIKNCSSMFLSGQS